MSVIVPCNTSQVMVLTRPNHPPVPLSPVPPEVSLFQKDSSSPVVCHATGFFPKAVMISWKKNGEDLDEDVELRETLPNQDRTFQKRSILTVPPEELKDHEYTCIIQHSSLEKEMVLQVSDLRGKKADLISDLKVISDSSYNSLTPL